MLYLRIKPKFDNCRRSDGSILIRNELYTEKEAERFTIPKDKCVVVNVSKKQVYWFFGARFSNDCGYDGK